MNLLASAMSLTLTELLATAAAILTDVTVISVAGARQKTWRRNVNQNLQRNLRNLAPDLRNLNLRNLALRNLDLRRRAARNPSLRNLDPNPRSLQSKSQYQEGMRTASTSDVVLLPS